MSRVPQFMKYAAAFEEAYAKNDFSLVEAYFTESASYEIFGMPPPLGGRVDGRAAILGYFARVLNGFDRKFNTRAVALVKGPLDQGNAVWIRGSVVYTAPGVPDLVFELDETAYFEGDRISKLEDRYDDETVRALVEYVGIHGKKLGLGDAS
jgi:hypothetical protein